MHLFVTGGTGFFGKALLRHWAIGRMPVLPEGARVTLLTRDPSRAGASCGALLRGLDVRLHRGDIMDPDSLPSDRSITHVLHAATDSTLGPGLSPLARYDQIVDGTRNVLDCAVRCCAGRLLLTSSGGVYGPQPATMERIPEDFLGMPDPLMPANAYSIGKRAAEHLCALYAQRDGLEVVVARCFAFVGPDLPLGVHFAIGNFIRDALEREAIVVGGDGTPLRSYLHQQDLAAWLQTLLEKGAPGRAYNVGSDEVVSIADLARLVRDLAAPGKAVQIRGVPDPSHARNRYVPDIERAKSELGLSVTIGLRQAIADTVASLVR